MQCAVWLAACGAIERSCGAAAAWVQCWCCGCATLAKCACSADAVSVGAVVGTVQVQRWWELVIKLLLQRSVSTQPSCSGGAVLVQCRRGVGALVKRWCSVAAVLAKFWCSFGEVLVQCRCSVGAVWVQCGGNVGAVWLQRWRSMGN